MVNTTAAIVALPAPLDSIRLVGDEDKHATLLFFGETSALPDTAKQTMLDSVKMASDMLFPFSESVVDVGRLGSEVPPALVAMLTGENLTQVRNLFMMNPFVKGFLDNADQHPQFNPHITLAHPDFVDEAILRSLMRQIWRVRFDRLAVWWNDERIEFDLGPPQTSDGGDMAMSEAIEKVLSHQAVKLGKKKGTKNHVLFIARGDKPKVGDQFSHQGQPHAVVSVATSPQDAQRHMVTAKPVPKETAKHFEWESYELDNAEQILAHVSTKPWSSYTAADYTPEQYKAACLVVRGDGSTKEQCKLPVKTPDGALSKPGVHAAAAALAGARGGVDLTPEERASAKKKLQGFYKQLGEDAPPSLAHALIALQEASEKDAQQHGVKGQKWGVRRSVDPSTGLVSGSSKLSLKRALGGKGGADGSGVTTGLKPRTGSADQIAQDRIAKKISTVGTKSLSNVEIQSYTRRLQLQKDLDAALASQSAAVQKKADGFIKSFVKNQANRQTNRIANAAADIAVEKALEAAGLKIGKKGGNPDAADMLVKVSGRIKPKKK